MGKARDNDAAILFPDETVEIDGEQVTVREFRYLEGLRAAALARPLLAGLREIIETDDDIEPEALDALIGEHTDIWVQLIAMSTGLSAERIGELSDRDGVTLSMAFWRVNGPFFTRRLLLASAVASGLSGRSRSRKSSTSSSAPATAATTGTSGTA